MRPYTKQPKSNEELVALLQSRGLAADSAKLLRILETVGYYRFTGYLYPFKSPNSNTFRPNTTLETAWNIYMKASNYPKIRHLATEYGIMDYPPIWTMMEIVPLGTVTFYFHGLPDGVQKAIADMFHVRPNVFGQWLMALKNVRNICAHHSRLWNFHIVAPFTKRIGRDPHLAPFVECLERQPSFNYTTTFTALSLCAYCMGVPANWETLALWQ